MLEVGHNLADSYPVSLRFRTHTLEKVDAKGSLDWSYDRKRLCDFTPSTQIQLDVTFHFKFGRVSKGDLTTMRRFVESLFDR